MRVPPPLLTPATWGDLTRENVLAWLLDRGLTILLILLGAAITRWLVHRIIDRAVRVFVNPRRSRPDEPPVVASAAGSADAPATAEPTTAELPVLRRHARRAARVLEAGFTAPERQAQRVRTLGSVLRSIASVVIYLTAGYAIGLELGINMAPVIASAGIGGVALGFGAQSLVKDFLSGMFMLAEDQYGVGDFIDTGTASGTVEEVSLRVTRLRDAQGVVWYIRNGEIVRVANKSQGWSTATVDIPVAYDSDPEKVIATLTTAMGELDEDPAWQGVLLETPNVAGVEAITGGTMTVRIFAKCAANEHWGVQREIRERALRALAEAGIKGPQLLGPYDGGRA